MDWFLKKLSQVTISEPGSSAETLEEPQDILTSLQSVNKYTGQIWKILKSRKYDKAPLLF